MSAAAMIGPVGPAQPSASWQRAKRHYQRLARRTDLAHLAAMQLVIRHALGRGYDQHFNAYTLPEFLAISTARSPEQALTTPFLSVAVDRDGVFELALVSPSSKDPLFPFRATPTTLVHELDSALAALGDLLVEQAERGL
jgi:hypothetical protein